MYRFLTEKELEDFVILREEVLEFYRKNANKTIPKQAILGRFENFYGNMSLYVDIKILKNFGLFSRSQRFIGKISLYKEIKVDENKNLMFDF